jgi:hypothetical protein
MDHVRVAQIYQRLEETSPKVLFKILDAYGNKLFQQCFSMSELDHEVVMMFPNRRLLEFGVHFRPGMNVYTSGFDPARAVFNGDLVIEKITSWTINSNNDLINKMRKVELSVVNHLKC